MRWEVEGRFKKEGTYVYLWLIHVDVWQRLTQYCKAITLQLKINNNNNKKDGTRQREHGQEGKVRGQGRNRKSPWPVQASLQPCSPALTPLPPHPCLLSLLRKERQEEETRKREENKKCIKEKMEKKKTASKREGFNDLCTALKVRKRKKISTKITLHA